MSLPAESPPGPVPEVEISNPSTSSGTSLVETPDNADIVSWAASAFPDIFPDIPSHRDLHFKHIDGRIFYDYKSDEIEIVSKVLRVGIYDHGDQNASENYDVYACIKPNEPGVVLFLHGKGNGQIYDAIRSTGQTHIRFEYPFTDVGKKGAFMSEIRGPLEALIHYYILADGSHQLIKPRGNEWSKIYPGFKSKLHAAFERISDNARAQDPATATRPVAHAPHTHTVAHADIPPTSLDAFDVGQQHRRRQPIRRARERQHEYRLSSDSEELSTTSEDETTEEACSDDIESSGDDSCSNTQSSSATKRINTKSENPRKRRRTKTHSDPDDADIELLQIAEKLKTDMTRVYKKSKAKYEKTILDLNSRIIDLESQLAQVKSTEDRQSAFHDEINSYKAENNKLREEAQNATMKMLEVEAKRRNAESDLEGAKTRAEQEEQKRAIAEKERDDIRTKWNNVLAVMGGPSV